MKFVMFCQYCGKPIGDDSRFCPYCGKKISSSVESETRNLNTITITRKEKDEAGLFKMKVSLDSGKPEKIKCGETINFQVTKPNPHVLKLTLNAQSKEWRFEYLGFPITIAYEIGEPTLQLNGNREWHETSAASSSMKFSAKTQYDNEGYLEVNQDGLTFELSNGTVLSFPFAEIRDVTESFSSFTLLMAKSNTFTFKLAHKDVKQVCEIIKKGSGQQFATAHPESSFDKSYGWSDKVMVNQKYRTFCIQPNGQQPGPVYKVDDILDFDIQDVIKEGGDVIEGAAIGGLIGGTRGALIGAAMQPTGRGKIKQIMFRARVNTNKGITTLTAKLMPEFTAVEKSSQEYHKYSGAAQELSTVLRALQYCVDENGNSLL